MNACFFSSNMSWKSICVRLKNNQQYIHISSSLYLLCKVYFLRKSPHCGLLIVFWMDIPFASMSLNNSLRNHKCWQIFFEQYDKIPSTTNFSFFSLHYNQLFSWSAISLHIFKSSFVHYSSSSGIRFVNLPQILWKQILGVIGCCWF